MKTSIKLWMLIMITMTTIPASFAVVGGQHVVQPALNENEIQLVGGIKDLTVEEFLNLTPKTIKEKTGKKLSLKEAIVLKKAQKKLKKSVNGAAPKSQLTALLLCLFVGFLGIHRFYLGYTGIGIIQLLTLGGCGIWSLIDLILIITGDLKPADGSEYDPKL